MRARWIPWILMAAALATAAWLVLGVGGTDPLGGQSSGGDGFPEGTREGPSLEGVGEATRAVGPAAARGDYTIRGRVLDAEGGPLPDVAVGVRALTPLRADPRDPGRWGDLPEEAFWRTLATLDATPASEAAPVEAARSGADGGFSLSVRGAGSYQVRAIVPPPRCSSRPTVHLGERSPTAEVTVSVGSGTVLRGRVVDATGRGVSAEVSGTSRRPGRTPWSAGPAATGADGAFVLEPLVEGAWALTVRVPGRLTLRGVPVTLPREEPLEIRIGAPGSALVGTVRDPAARPVAGATVMITVAAEGEVVVLASLRGTAGDDGTWRVDEVPLGTVAEVTAHAPGFAVHRSAPPLASWSGATVVARRETRIDLTLEPGAVIEGRVLEAGTGRPLADVDVYAAVGADRRGAPASRPIAARSSSDGTYRLEGVPPGRVVLLAQGPRHLLRAVAETRGSGGPLALGPDGSMPRDGAPEDLTLVIAPDGGTYRRDLTLVPGVVLRGTVLDPAGRPTEGAEVVARGAGLATAARQWAVSWPGGVDTLGRSDGEGRFEASPLPASGSVVLVASKSPHVGGSSEPVLLAGGDRIPEVTIRLGDGATIEGRVLDPTGSPVGDVGVNLWGAWADAPTAATWTNTDAAGGFRFEGIPAGDLTVHVSTSRWRAPTFQVPAVRPGERRTGIEIRLEEGVRFAGTLVDREGRALASRGLTLWSAGGGGTPSPSHATTAADGAFEFLAAPRGRVSIQVDPRNDSQPPLSLAGGMYESPADGVRLVAEVRQVRVIEGTVTDVSGTPVPLFDVRVDGGGPNTGHEGRVYPPGGPAPEEGVNGRFRGIAAGDPPYRVRISRARDASGRPLNLRTQTVQAEDLARPLEIRLSAGLEITGEVLGPDRRGVAGVSVSGGGASTRTDAEGVFTLAGLEEGLVQVACRPPSGCVPVSPVSARAGTAGLRFELRAGLPVAGSVVRADGTPASQGAVTATWPAAGDSPAGRLAVPLEGGRFRLEGIPEGAAVTLDVQVWSAMGARQAAPTRLETVAGATDLVVRIEDGVALSGVVVDAAGRPFAAAFVVVTPEEGGSAPTPSFLSPDADGAFHVQGLSRGPYRVHVQRHDGGPAPEPLRVTPPATGLRLELPRGERIAGRVAGEGDLRGFFVYARPETASASRWVTAPVNSDGSFTLENVGAGPQVLSATHADDDRYALATGVRPGSTNVRLDLRPGLVLEGRIEAEDAAGPFWLQVEGESWSAFPQSRPDGAFRVRGLPPGRYRLTAHSAQGRSVRLEDVAAGTRGLLLRIPR